MIEVRNRQVYRGITFDEYQALPGWSHSAIRQDGRVDIKPPTGKMLLGSAVHQYLLEPEKYNHENINIVKPVAAKLKQVLGPLLKYCEPELSVTADFVVNGLVMGYRGRIDLGILKRLVVDIKVSPVPLKISKERYDYDSQQSGYALAIEAGAAIILRIDPNSCQPGKVPIIETYNVPISADWWKWQTVQKGKPL